MEELVELFNKNLNVTRNNEIEENHTIVNVMQLCRNFILNEKIKQEKIIKNLKDNDDLIMNYYKNRLNNEILNIRKESNALNKEYINREYYIMKINAIYDYILTIEDVPTETIIHIKAIVKAIIDASKTYNLYSEDGFNEELYTDLEDVFNTLFNSVLGIEEEIIKTKNNRK